MTCPVVGVRTFCPGSRGYLWTISTKSLSRNFSWRFLKLKEISRHSDLPQRLRTKNGVTQTELSEWYGVQRRTIYSWLQRLETRPLAQAVQDDHHSGRPRKLTDEQQKELEQTLQQPPAEAGIDAPASTPALLTDFLEETFDVDYSLPSCRRLMKEAGLSYQKPHRTAVEAEPADRDEFHDELKKKRREMDATVVCLTEVWGLAPGFRPIDFYPLGD